MTRLRHYDNLGTARFITFCCHRRYGLLTNEEVITTFLEELRITRNKYGLRILGYVVMPEHVHLVLYPENELKLGPVIGELKSLSARRILSSWKERKPDALEDLLVNRAGVPKHAFWQRRCFDHNCRSEKTVLEKISYCHDNPVRRGLVEEPGDWKWSSYWWYQDRRDVPLEIDGYEQ